MSNTKTPSYDNSANKIVKSIMEKYSSVVDEDSSTKDRIVSIDWNKADSHIGLEFYQLTKQNFWVPDKYPVGNDVQTITQMKEDEVFITMKNYQALSMFDTIQSTLGIYRVMGGVDDSKYKAVLAGFDNIEFIHAESYGYIFSSLVSSQYEARLRRWELLDPNLFLFQKIIVSYYNNAKNDIMLIKLASVILEGILFYSGFYLPIYWESKGIMTNTAELIRVIVRDERYHTGFIGYLYRKELETKTPEQKEYYYNTLMTLFNDLYPVILEFNRSMYAPLGLEDKVNRFVKMNINRTFSLLGYKPIMSFNDGDPDPFIIAALSDISISSHNIFSKSGTSYWLAPEEVTTDEDYLSL